jgi:BirA family biotin operon repressor/biotin-[acetyl-CoA-carboxylase] ligase
MARETTVAHDCLSIELIRRTLSAEIVGRRICLLWDVASTNDVLRRMAEASAPAGTVVLAEGQHAGRARAGLGWFSPVGVNLYASVLFRPVIRPDALPVFSFIASLATSDAIRLEGQPAMIKWPNDVLVGRKKVAGTLVESAAANQMVAWVVFGIGVNVNVDRQALRAGLGAAAEDAASLSELAGREIDRNAFTGTLLTCLDRWFHMYAGRGAEPILAGWRERDGLAGHRVQVRAGGEECEGRVGGVSREGFLIVEDARGQTHRIVDGQIRLLD